MNGTRQQIQYSLALEQADQGEAPVSGHQRTEPFVAKPAPASSAVTEQLMEEVCNRENLVRAKGGNGRGAREQERHPRRGKRYRSVEFRVGAPTSLEAKARRSRWMAECGSRNHRKAR